MSAPDSFRIEYTEDEAYLLEAYDRLPPALRTDKSGRLGLLLLAGLLVGLTTYRAIMDFRAGEQLWWLSPVLVPVALVAVWWFTLSAPARRRAYARGVRQYLDGGTRRDTVTFDEEGFTSALDDGRSKTHLWADVPRAILRTDGCFIFIDATTSFWFPKRVFAPEDDFQRLETLLARKVPNIERTAA